MVEEELEEEEKKEQMPEVIFFPGNRPGCSPFFFVLVKIVVVDQWY